MSNILRNHHTVFHSGCTLHSQPSGTYKVTISLYLFFVIFNRLVIFCNVYLNKNVLVSFNIFLKHSISSVQFLSCVWLCNPMDGTTPGFPVYHQLWELAQMHVQPVGDDIQPSHPLSSPSPPSPPAAFNFSRHQGLFQWVSYLHQVTKVLELQHQSFQWIFRDDFL